MNDLPIRLTGCAVLPPMEPRKPKEPSGLAGERRSEKPPDADRPKRKAADRFAVINAFVDRSMTDLSRAELATWFVLWRDTKNGTARTGASDIARRIGTSRRAVTNALAGLVRRGLVTVVRRGGLNRGASEYRVNALAEPSQRGKWASH